MKKLQYIPALVEEKENCPNCGAELIGVEGGIGGFAGHPFVHSGMSLGYRCHNCQRHFTFEEFLRLKEEKVRGKGIKSFFSFYWLSLRALLLNPFFCLVILLVLIGKPSWTIKGVVILALIIFLPLLFATLYKLLASIDERVKEHKTKSTP